MGAPVRRGAAQELNTTVAEVEPLLVTLILDGRIDGLIDQVQQRLTLARPYGPAA